MQSSAVSFKLFFQQMTEEGHRFPECQSREAFAKRKWSSGWDHGVYNFYFSRSLQYSQIW